MEKAFYVYIPANRHLGTIYTGVTSDLTRRLDEHRNNRLDGFTARHSVHRLGYYEVHNDSIQAITREKQLKKCNRSWKIKLIEGMNPTWDDLWETLNH